MIWLLSNFDFHVPTLMATDFVMIREHLFFWPDTVSYSWEFIIATETMDLPINESLFKTKPISIWLWTLPYCHTEHLTTLLVSTILINFKPEKKSPDKTSRGPKWTFLLKWCMETVLGVTVIQVDEWELGWGVVGISRGQDQAGNELRTIREAWIHTGHWVTENGAKRYIKTRRAGPRFKGHGTFWLCLWAELKEVVQGDGQGGLCLTQSSRLEMLGVYYHFFNQMHPC